MKRRMNGERGSAATAAVIVLLLIVGAIVLWHGRSVEVVDLRETGEKAAVDLEKAAETLRNESSDALTTTKVKTALALSKSVSAFDIDVDSQNGLVALSGRVPSHEVRDAAMRIAGDVSGVKETVDRLEIVPGESPAFDVDDVSDRLGELELKTKVYEALLREPDADASRVRVTVIGDTVTLEGSVPRLEDVERLGHATESVKGVEALTNRLVVAEEVTRVVEPKR